MSFYLSASFSMISPLPGKPFFMNRESETQEEFVLSSIQEGAHYFVAKQNGKRLYPAYTNSVVRRIDERMIQLGL